MIQYSLANTGDVSLAIFDIRGRLVRVLVDEKLDAGTYREPWDGRDQTGRFVPGGVYFSRMDYGSLAGGRCGETNKLIFLK